MTWKQSPDISERIFYLRHFYGGMVQSRRRGQWYILMSCAGYLSSNLFLSMFPVISILCSLIMQIKHGCQGHGVYAKFRIDMLISALPPDSVNSFSWTSYHVLEIKGVVRWMLFSLYCITFPLRQELERFYLLVERRTGPIILTHTKIIPFSTDALWLT